MKLLIMVGTSRCDVSARVQRAEYNIFVNHYTKSLRRCTRRGQRSALSLPFLNSTLCLSTAQSLNEKAAALGTTAFVAIGTVTRT
jgi:hypothetical protein